MIYSLGELTACVIKQCQQIEVLEACIVELKSSQSPTVTLQKTFQTCCVGISGATVNVNGQVVNTCGNDDFAIVRTATGLYDFTAPPGAIFAHIQAIEGPITRDSISIHMGTSFTGGTGWIGEGDNGTTANIPIDKPFSIIWYGDKDILVDVVIQSEGGSASELNECPFGTTNFFNEQQFAWGFGIQNNSNTETMDPWQYVISGANYQLDINQITNSTEFTYQEIANADGTFEHIFTGVNPLGPNDTTPNFQWNGVNFGNPITSSNQQINC